jgi:hypothetical protein
MARWHLLQACEGSRLRVRMKSEGLSEEVEITVLAVGIQEEDDLAGGMMSGEISQWVIGGEAKNYQTPPVGDREVEGGGSRHPVLSLIASRSIIPIFHSKYRTYHNLSGHSLIVDLGSIESLPWALSQSGCFTYVHILNLQCPVDLFLVNEVALSLRSEIPESLHLSAFRWSSQSLFLDLRRSCRRCSP